MIAAEFALTFILDFRLNIVLQTDLDRCWFCSPIVHEVYTIIESNRRSNAYTINWDLQSIEQHIFLLS